MKKPLHITTRPPYYLSDFTVVTSSLVKFSSLYLSLFHRSIWVKGLRYVWSTVNFKATISDYIFHCNGYVSLFIVFLISSLAVAL